MNGYRTTRLALAGLLLGVLSVSSAGAQCPLYRLPSTRFGADLSPSFGTVTDYDVAALHIGWYSDWASTTTPLRPGGIEYAQLLWITNGAGPSLSTLGPKVDANPGALWMIGNEPECTYAPGGGNNTPQQYGDAYHQFHDFIKGRDPTARIAIGGVVQPTPLRLKWLDQLLAYYQSTYGEPIPVDVWNIHNMILQEKRGSWGCGIPAGLTENEGRLYTVDDNADIEIFKQHVWDFRTWMNSHGLRDKPLVISEYGVLMPVEYGFTPQRVSAFMIASFDFLLNTRDVNLGYPADSNLLVQRWLWNSLNDEPYNFETGRGFNGALYSHLNPRFPGTLTYVGTQFKAYTDALLTGAACLSADVGLEGRPAPPNASYITTGVVTLYSVDCPEPDLRSVTTDATGHFTLCQVPPGTYDITVKGFNTLANRVDGVSITVGGPVVDLGMLRSGDANHDNCVTILDFSMLATAYATSTGAPAFDPRADFNADGYVDILDFSLLATHFSECGAE